MSHPTASPQIPSLSFGERTDRMTKVLGIGPGGGGGGGCRGGGRGGGGGVLDISLGGEVRLGPSYPDPV